MSASVIMHPRTLAALRDRTEAQGFSTLGESRTLDGLPVYTNDAVPEFVTRWEFPEDPFIEYEEADEPWARYFGIGREVEDRTQRAIFVVDDLARSPWQPQPQRTIRETLDIISGLEALRPRGFHGIGAYP